jgi:hypothetical protein
LYNTHPLTASAPLKLRVEPPSRPGYTSPDDFNEDVIRAAAVSPDTPATPLPSAKRLPATVRAVLMMMLRVDYRTRLSSKEAHDMLVLCLAAHQRVSPPATTTHFMHGSDAAPDPEGSDALLPAALLPSSVVSSNLFLCTSVQDVQIWLQYARQAFVANAVCTMLTPGRTRCRHAAAAPQFPCRGDI